MKQHSLREVIRELKELGLCTVTPPIQDVEKTLYLPSENLEAFSKFLRTVLEPTRFKILYLLRQSPLPVCIIAYMLGQDRTLISHHLVKLMELNLVRVKRVKRFNIYSLTEHGSTIVDKILGLYKEVASPETISTHSKKNTFTVQGINTAWRKESIKTR